MKHVTLASMKCDRTQQHMLQTLLVSILPSQVANGCNEKLTSVVMKMLYFTLVIQA